jgi:hypothetical protein
LKLFGTSDFSGNWHLVQDYYATGDAKALEQQNASISTPLGQHIVNSVTYNEQHPIGPADVPFQLLDNLPPGSHGAQDVLRFFNRNVYALSLSTGTNFDREAQPVSYQLTVKPSVRSYLVLGGFWTPGPGNGFGTTNVQVITPFGRDTSLQFTTNVDWKNKGRLEDKNIYLSKIIGNCYDLQFTYNQDLKQFNFNVVILAFPNQAAGFGFGGQNSLIIPRISPSDDGEIPLIELASARAPEPAAGREGHRLKRNAGALVRRAGGRRRDGAGLSQNQPRRARAGRRGRALVGVGGIAARPRLRGGLWRRDLVLLDQLRLVW